jgi:hypothetical protein
MRWSRATWRGLGRGPGGDDLVVLTEISWNRVYEWLASTNEYLAMGARR